MISGNLSSTTQKTAITLMVALISIALCLLVLKDTSGIKTSIVIVIGVIMTSIALPALLNIKAGWVTRAMIATAAALTLTGIHAYFK